MRLSKGNKTLTVYKIIESNAPSYIFILEREDGTDFEIRLLAQDLGDAKAKFEALPLTQDFAEWEYSEAPVCVRGVECLDCGELLKTLEGYCNPRDREVELELARLVCPKCGYNDPREELTAEDVPDEIENLTGSQAQETALAQRGIVGRLADMFRAFWAKITGFFGA